MPWAGDKWIPEDDSASSKVAAITSKDSAFMRSASATGERSANRRGVINSTMGIGAGVSAGLNAAIPIASQDAQQIYGKNVQAMQMQGQDKQIELGDRQIAANDRQAQAAQITQLGSTYTQGIGNTLQQNDKIPASTRTMAQNDMASLYSRQLAQIQALYAPKTGPAPVLNWGGAAPAASAGV